MKKRFLLVQLVLLFVLVLLPACINMKPYQAIERYLEQGDRAAAEFVVDSMLQRKLRKLGRSPMTGRELDTILGFELAHWAVFYRQCGAYEKSEQCDSMAAGYLGRGFHKRHPEYLEARYDQAYVMLLRGKKAEALATMKEVRDVLLAAPEAGKANVDLHDLYEFYFRAGDMNEVKRVVKRGLAHTQPMYRNVQNEKFQAINVAPELWHFDKVKKEHLYDFNIHLREAMMYNHTLPDPICAEYYMLVDKALNDWYDSSPRGRNNINLAYALNIGGTGRSTRALEITNHAYNNLRHLTGVRSVDYAVGATNYASIYMDYAMNNCVEAPFTYLDSIYTADCHKLNGQDDDAIRQYLGCQCGQTLLRVYAGALDSAAVSMERARGAWRALGMEKQFVEQFAGRYATYAGTLFEVSLAQGNLGRCDSIISVGRSAPLTVGAWRHKLDFMEAKLALQRGDHSKAATILMPVRGFVDEYRRMGTMTFSVANSREVLGVYETADALELTALLALGGKEERIRSILDSRKLRVSRARMSAYRTQRQGHVDPASTPLYARWQATRKELETIVTNLYAGNKMRSRMSALEDSLYMQELQLSLLYRNWAEQAAKNAGEERENWTVEASLTPKASVVDVHRVHLYDGRTASFHASYLLMVRKASGPPAIVRVDEADELDRLVRMVNAAHTANSSAEAHIDRLSELLLSPLLPGLAGMERVYFCNDGGLSLLNWAYLKNGNKRLCETHAVQHVYGMDALRWKYITGYFSNVRDAVFIGDPLYYAAKGAPGGGSGTRAEGGRFREFLNGAGLDSLPGTRAEVEQVAAMTRDGYLTGKFERKVKTLLGEQASEPDVKGVGNVGLLHIATHGFYERDGGELAQMYRLNDTTSIIAHDPLIRSGLLLAGSGDFLSSGSGIPGLGDGILSAAEISEMDLSKAELVVLSACNSGQGVVATADGVDGLQQGFFLAGAKAVMVSYWKVDDTFTALFMNEFYRRWTGQERYAEDALRSTQRHFMAMPAYRSPRYWASFAIISR